MATDFVEKFKRYLKEDGKSPKTIERYIGDIAGFVDYIQSMWAIRGPVLNIFISFISVLVISIK